MVLRYDGLDTRRMAIARMAPVFAGCAFGIRRRKGKKKGPHMFLYPAILPVGEGEWCNMSGAPEETEEG